MNRTKNLVAMEKFCHDHRCAKQIPQFWTLLLPSQQRMRCGDQCLAGVQLQGWDICGSRVWCFHRQDSLCLRQVLQVAVRHCRVSKLGGFKKAFSFDSFGFLLASCLTFVLFRLYERVSMRETLTQKIPLAISIKCLCFMLNDAITSQRMKAPFVVFCQWMSLGLLRKQHALQTTPLLLLRGGGPPLSSEQRAPWEVARSHKVSWVLHVHAFRSIDKCSWEHKLLLKLYYVSPIMICYQMLRII